MIVIGRIDQHRLFHDLWFPQVAGSRWLLGNFDSLLHDSIVDLFPHSLNEIEL